MSNPQIYTIRTGHLRLVFERHEDRWSHRVDLVSANGKSIPLFASVEGTPESSALPSPPLQELQMRDDGQAVLGVGMAGRDHWSLTCGVRPVEASPGDSRSIRWEVACRVKSDFPFLASTYRIGEPVQIAAHNDHAIELSAAGHGVRVRTPDATASIMQSRIEIHAPDVERATPRTVRWSYSITLTRSTAARES